MKECGRDARATAGRSRPATAGKPTKYEERVLAHAGYFAELIEREGERLKGHGQPEALKILGVELENIYEGLDTALNLQDAQLLLLFAKYLASYLEMVSRWLEGLAWYERIAAKAEELKDPALHIQVWLGLARLLWRVSRYDEAGKAASTGKRLAQEQGDACSTASLLRYLGHVSKAKGCLDETERLYQESLRVFREMQDYHGVANCLNDFGLLAISFGRYEEAKGLHEESLQIKREIGERYGIAASLNNLGLVAWNQGRYEEAEKLHRESLEMKRKVGKRYGIAISLSNLGMLARVGGRCQEAERLYQESLQIRREIGDRWGIAESLNQLGVLAEYREKYDEAEELYQESLEIFREIGGRLAAANVLSNLSAVNINLGCLGAARDYLEQSLRESKAMRASPLSVGGALLASRLLNKANSIRESALLTFEALRCGSDMGRALDPLEQRELDEGMAKLKEALSEEELAETKARAEKMSLEELTEFALKALAELEL